MHPRVPDRAGLLSAIELGAVVRDQGEVALAADIRKQEAVLLPLPPEILNVIHLMIAEQPTERFEKLDRNILIEQKLIA